MNAESLFEYTFIDNQASKTLFLLHGTGGTKDDFLFLNDGLKQKFNLVGLQGNILEQGNRRFFKRIAEGVFDQESIHSETEKLEKFIDNWKTKHEVTNNSLYFLGYSNGANMILATLLRFPDLIDTAVLLRPMWPLSIPESLDISKKSLLVCTGSHDPLISEHDNQQLIKALQEKKPQLTVKEYNTGHQLSKDEFNDVLQFILQS